MKHSQIVAKSSMSHLLSTAPSLARFAIRAAGRPIGLAKLIVLFALLPIALPAATWTSPNPGNLTTGSNWGGGVAPNGINQVAIISTNPTNLGDFTLNNTFKVGNFDYQNSQDRWIRGSGLIDFDVSSGNALLSVQNGELTVEPGINLNLSDDTETRIATRADILGTITGARSVVKSGDGYLYLYSANSYSGGTTISGGHLIVGNTTGSGTGSGNITISFGSLQIGSGGTRGAVSANIINNGNVFFARSDNFHYVGEISGSGSVAQYGAGILTLSGNNTYTGDTGIVNGTLRLGASERLPDTSVVYAYADCTLDLNNFNETIGSLHGEGSVSLGSGMLTTGGNNLDTVFSGIVSGAGGLTKQGSGNFILANANTYSGGTTISGGSVYAQNTSGSATGSGDVTISTGRLTVGFATTRGSVSGNIILNGYDSLVDFYQSYDAQYAGQISGSGYLYKEGSGTLTLTGSHTYSGLTSISAGTLKLTAYNLLPNASRVIVDGVLDLNNFPQSIGSLSGAGSVTLGSGILSTGQDNLSTTFTGVISGSGGLAKTGTGTLTLSGNNTFTRGTAINDGTVLFNGTNSGGPTAVYHGTLGGNGFLGTPASSAHLNIVSRLAPGSNSYGTLTVAGDVHFQSGSFFDIEIAGRTSGFYDQLVVNNTLEPLSGKAELGGTIQVALRNSFKPAAGDSFQILFAASGFSGTFSGIAAPAVPNIRWNLSYLGNSVFLNALAAVSGDVNVNGVVDAADYVMWRKTGGTQQQYHTWRTNFGQTAGSGAGNTYSASIAAVPEPNTALSLLTGSALWHAVISRRTCRREKGAA